MYLIECNNLGFMTPAKRKANLLQNVSFTLPQGARLALAGGNGAGKSTFLKLLLGLEPIGEGEVSILGSLVPSVKSRTHIGYLADEPSPFAYLSGKEYLELYGRLEGFRGNELKDKVVKALSQSGLTDAANVRTENYSKGMRQRLEIERVMLKGRKLILLDEPLTGLDIESQLFFKKRLNQLAADGVSMIITSHEPSILEAVATHIAVLHFGKLAVFGKIDKLLTEKGWEIVYKDSQAVPDKLPKGAKPGGQNNSFLFSDRKDAETELKNNMNEQVLSFGSAIKGIEDLMAEVTAK